MIGAAIITLLNANAGLTNLVGTNIFSVIVPENKTAPWIIYELKTQPKYETKDIEDNDETTIDIMLVHTSYLTASQIATKVRDSLEFKTGTYNNTTISDLELIQIEDDYFEPEKLYIKYMQFKAEHTRD
jgi:hypothetical protein